MGTRNSRDKCRRSRLKEESVFDFGLIIAYLLPGGLVLWGLGQIVPAVQAWLNAATIDTTTVGGFFFVALASLGGGLLASLIRWFVIDRLHHWTGLRPPHLDFAKLAERTAAFALLIEVHYKYYQFYANSLVAGAFAYICWRSQHPLQAALCIDAVAMVLLLLLAAGSRDTLRRYYTRSGALLGEEACSQVLISLND